MSGTRRPAPVDQTPATGDPGGHTLPPLEIVHQGRGGVIRIDDCAYPIEHVEGGRFCIHFPAGQSPVRRAAHLAALTALVRDEAPKWEFARR